MTPARNIPEQSLAVRTRCRQAQTRTLKRLKILIYPDPRKDSPFVSIFMKTLTCLTCSEARIYLRNHFLEKGESDANEMDNANISIWKVCMLLFLSIVRTITYITVLFYFGKLSNNLLKYRELMLKWTIFRKQTIMNKI